MARTILLVEDDADLRQALLVRLGASGYRLLMAADGQGAVATVQRERPDLVLLDLGLPAGDGFTVLERLGRLGASGRIPVVVLTGRSSEADHQRALSLGARAVLLKPPDNAELLAAIAANLPPEAPPKAELPSLGRVLVIEDDADTRLGLRLRLQASRYDVSVAGDAATAMTRALQDKPHVILLDLGLPAGDGFVVLERLKRNPSTATIPVIVLSAREPTVNAPKALKAGAVAFLQKPADNDEMLEAIRRALGPELA